MGSRNVPIEAGISKINRLTVYFALAIQCVTLIGSLNYCLAAANSNIHDDSLDDELNSLDSFIQGSSSHKRLANRHNVRVKRQMGPPPPPPPGMFGMNFVPNMPPFFEPFRSPKSDEVCGLSMKDIRPERIVGGRSAFFGEVPFVVHLRESQLFRVLGFNKCGGVLINHKWAITAGHCKPAFYSSLEVILGKHKTFEDAPPPNGTTIAGLATKLISSSSSSSSDNMMPPRSQDKQVLQMLADTVIVHPDYDAKTLENDLALIKFKNPVPYRDDIQPICMPYPDEDFAGLDGYATGWGLVDFDKRQLPENLQIVRLPIMTNKRCQSMYKKAGHDKQITDHDLCAGYAKGGMDACEGDSGGPLIVRRPNDQRWVLAGIVSNGVKCGEPLLPGVYTRVSKFIPWIREQIRIHS